MSGRTKREDEADGEGSPTSAPQHVRQSSSTSSLALGDEQEEADSIVAQQKEMIKNSVPSTELEVAQDAALKRQAGQIERLSLEVKKLKAFISKRKQTYKRKRKDEGAPTRALSAYNIFVQDRFSKLAKDNEAALQSDDTNIQLKRVPPASLVASTGNEWKELPSEQKSKYEELAKADKRRYEEQMAQYQPPEKEAAKKRNKTGYNMFFSAYVLQLKQSAAGVPPERGSVARLVGNAWKELTSEEKQYYEREAEKRNELEGAPDPGPSTEADTKMPTSIPQLAASPSGSRGAGMRHEHGMPEHRLAHSPVHAHYHGQAVPHHHLGHAPPFGMPPQPGYGHPSQGGYYSQGQHPSQAAPPHYGQAGHHSQGHHGQQQHHHRGYEE